MDIESLSLSGEYMYCSYKRNILQVFKTRACLYIHVNYAVYIYEVQQQARSESKTQLMCKLKS
jgi:hypothetical protein